MKIVMFSHYFGSHKGGIEVVCEELYRRFAAITEKVTWIAGGVTPPPENIAGGRVVPLRVLNFIERKVGLPFPIPTLRAIQQLNFAVRGADVVLLHDCLYLSNIIAFWAARRHRVPIVIVQHTRFTPYRSAVLNLLMSVSQATIVRRMLSSADQVIFISEATRQTFENVRFQRKPEVIWNGVNTRMYHPPYDIEPRKIRTQYDLPPNRPVILFVGRFVEKKGIAIMREMVKLRSDWTWVFAGWGPVDPRTWNEENVKVYSNLWGETIAELYRISDLLVLPSTGEGFPLVVQEALSSGISVVCGADTLQADPAMSPFVHGVEVDVRNEQQTAKNFVSCIDAALSSGGNEEDRQRRRDFAIERYDWKRAVNQYLAILQEVATRAASFSEGSDGRF